MILRHWADELADSADLATETAEAVDFHVADTAGAFFAGSLAPEGQALARYFGDDSTSLKSAARRAGAIASITRHTEIDDIHVASCVTPGSAVIATAFALMPVIEDGAARAERAIVAGYAIGIRLGLSIGGAGALAAGIWPSLLAAPVMAAATASVCLGLDRERTVSALALAVSGTGGRIGRISATPSGRWLVFGEAVAKGCNAALAAAEGFQADPNLVSADWLTALATGAATNPDMLISGPLDEAICTTGFKPFVAARQTINAIHAFQSIMADENLAANDIDRVEVGVPGINAAMVARVALPGDRLGTISSMPIQIAAAAVRPGVLFDIERSNVPDRDMTAFAQRVSVVSDAALDALLPDVWAGRASVISGERRFERACLQAPGDRPDGAGSVIGEKLIRFVPARYRDICAAQMPDHCGARPARRRRLQQGIFQALRGWGA